MAFVLWYLERSCTSFSCPYFSKCRGIIRSTLPGVGVCKMVTILCRSFHEKVESGSPFLKSRIGFVAFFDILNVAEMMS